MRSAYILPLALQMPSSRFISFKVIASLFAHPPSPVYTYKDVPTPGLYRIDMGIFLALGRPEYASCRPLSGLPPSGGITQPLLQILYVCIGP